MFAFVSLDTASAPIVGSVKPIDRNEMIDGVTFRAVQYEDERAIEKFHDEVGHTWVLIIFNNFCPSFIGPPDGYI